MKKLIVSISLVLYAVTGFSQLLKPVQLDNAVTVSLPTGYQKSDINGEQTFSGKTSYGFVIVTRTVNPSSNKVLKKEKDLKNVFKAYVDQIKASSEGTSILFDKDTIVNNLEVHDFTLQTDTGSGVQLRNFRLLYTKPVTYTFDYSYNEQTQEVAQKEMNAFFASIKNAPDLDGTDQFIMYGKKVGMSALAVIAIVAGGLLIIGTAVVLVRKKREVALA